MIYQIDQERKQWLMDMQLFMADKDNRELKFAEQRMMDGFADSDLWNVDSWLCDLMKRALLRFAKTTYAYPGNSTSEEWKRKIKKYAKAWGEYKDLCDLPMTIHDHQAENPEDGLTPFERAGKKYKKAKKKWLKKIIKFFEEIESFWY